jgi:hypothetical protein
MEQFHQDSPHTEGVSGDGRWSRDAAVERGGFGCPLGILRTPKGGKSGIKENPMLEGLFQPFHLLLVIVVAAVVAVVTVVPYWQIFRKAGFNPWLSLLMLFPLVSLIAIFWLGIAKWPERAK